MGSRVGPRVHFDAFEKETLSFLLRTADRFLGHPAPSLICTPDALSREMWIPCEIEHITFLCVKLFETELGRSH